MTGPKCLNLILNYFLKIDFVISYPPASKVSREIANLTERKNLYTLVYGVKEFVCLSGCLIYFSMSSVSTFKEELNLMLKVFRLLVKVQWV